MEIYDRGIVCIQEVMFERKKGLKLINNMVEMFFCVTYQLLWRRL